jgi:S-adenosylmethionine:tRNA ribosyltransferase-isomerase
MKLTEDPATDNPGENITTPVKLEADCQLGLDDFNYALPPELIAQEPLPERTASRLMVVSRQDKQIDTTVFENISTLLKKGDVLILNDTKVIPARIFVSRSSGAKLELLLVKPVPERPGRWYAMASKLRRLNKGESLIVDAFPEFTIEVSDIVDIADGGKRLIVNLGSQENTVKLLSKIGKLPLPHYIKREHIDQAHDDQDALRYQTVFAKTPGAVAAPTAGLHFSEDLLRHLQEMGVQIGYITLHVGPGTFKPITTDIQSHVVDAEQVFISEETANLVNKALAEKRRVIAVGTTSCRCLEGSFDGLKVEAVSGRETNLYIRPGYRFRVISGLITNFHLPQSSLLVLVSAFGGHDLMQSAYAKAIAERFRFYSYGDAMFIC